MWLLPLLVQWNINEISSNTLTSQQTMNPSISSHHINSTTLLSSVLTQESTSSEQTQTTNTYTSTTESQGPTDRETLLYSTPSVTITSEMKSTPVTPTQTSTSTPIPRVPFPTLFPPDHIDTSRHTVNLLIRDIFVIMSAIMFEVKLAWLLIQHVQ